MLNKTASYISSAPLTQKKAWAALKNLSEKPTFSLIEAFDKNPSRAESMSLSVSELFCDYSKNWIGEAHLNALCTLAESCHLNEAIQALMSGGVVNTTENKAAWHTGLREALCAKKSRLPEAIQSDIEAQFIMMKSWVEALHIGYQGATGQTIEHIVHIGIGGSDLGPKMLYEALKPFHINPIDVRFVSNVDPKDLLDHLKVINPHKTLFILASKSFTTSETLENAKIAKAWLQTHLKSDQINQHFIGITANPKAAQKWGILESHLLNFWDWLGGRYSIWSAISLSVAVKIGFDSFLEFLQGGYEMDQHFEQASFEQNLPVILGLLGIWYINFKSCPTQAILPYDQGLQWLPSYLQQLDMESNGKTVDKKGKPVDYETGPIIWGQTGTNGQHAFYQLLHQGSHDIPADFILSACSSHSHTAQHDLLLSNALAQTQALMIGDQNPKSPHQAMPGNKPSTTILLKRLTPKTLGMLIALYEHKVFVQGVIWGINSFDQPGVELGKKLARELAQSFSTSSEGLDPSSRWLLDQIKQYQNNS